MVTHSSATAHEHAKDRDKLRSPWPGLLKAAFIVTLLALFLMLGLSMVHHRFFRGGQIDTHGVLRP